MRQVKTIAALAILCCCCTQAWASRKDRIGEKLVDVQLMDLQGNSVSLLDQHSGKVLVIAYTGVGCPISGRYAPRLEALVQKYKKKGMRLVAINANPNDAPEKIAAEAKELGTSFPILIDHTQALTRQVDAKTTTVVFVVDQDHIIRYRGMIDDQYAVGAQRDKPRNKYLESAIKAVLRGQKPFVSRTAAPGCLITRLTPIKSDNAVTYSSHIAAIVQDNCQKCHRLRQIAPFPLTTYEEVAGWSAMIHSVLTGDRMPPWNASRDFDGMFANQRRIPDPDKQMLLAWIEGGMPRGDPEQDPEPREWPKGWRIGKPDKIYKMTKPFQVPAEGVVEYQYFKVQTKFKKDKWIKAVEAQAGAADVVHHILVFIDENDDFDRESAGLDGGFLCVTVPGDTPSFFPPGTAKRLPAGATLHFQVHYTTNGKKRKDRSRVGMIFTDEPVEREVQTRGIYNLNFEIPPGDNNYEVRAEYDLPMDTELLALFPHMHFRGKDWKYIAKFPDGREQVLLDVPRYDFNWQESYIFKTPLFMPKGTTLLCVAHYDNSEANFANPDPTKPVSWGEQTWEEMMIGYFDHVPVRREADPAAAASGEVTADMLGRGAAAYATGSCAKCHRANGTGGPRGPNLTDDKWLHCDGSIEGIERVLRRGVPRSKLKDSSRPFAMNPVTNLISDREQIHMLAVYVWNLSQQ